jgi:hypothetical protein
MGQIRGGFVKLRYKNRQSSKCDGVRYSPKAGKLQDAILEFSAEGDEGTHVIDAPDHNERQIKSYEPNRSGTQFFWEEKHTWAQWMCVVVFPPGYTLPKAEDASPVAQWCEYLSSTNRLALCWILDGNQQRVSWRMEEATGKDLRKHCSQLNEAFQRPDAAMEKPPEPTATQPPSPAIAVTTPSGTEGTPEATTTQPQPASSSINTMTWAYLSVLIFFIVLLLWQYPRIRDVNIAVVKYAVLIIAAVVAALPMFGLLHSTGYLRSEKGGVLFELGGAAAYAFAIIGLGTYYDLKHQPDTFVITIYLVSAVDNKTMHSDGAITLRTNPPRQAEIHNGIAEFRELPATVSGQEVEYDINVKGYDLAPDAAKKLLFQPGTSLTVLVRPKKQEVDNESTWDVLFPSGIPRRWEALRNEITRTSNYLSDTFKRNLDARRKANHYLEAENEDARFFYVSRIFPKGEAPKEIRIAGGVEAYLVVFITEGEKAVLRKVERVEPRENTIFCDYKDVVADNVALLAVVYPLSEGASRFIANQPEFEKIADVRMRKR